MKPLGGRLRYRVLSGLKQPKIDGSRQSSWPYTIPHRIIVPRMYYPPVRNVGWKMKWDLNLFIRRGVKSYRVPFRGQGSLAHHSPPRCALLLRPQFFVRRDSILCQGSFAGAGYRFLDCAPPGDGIPQLALHVSLQNQTVGVSHILGLGVCAIVGVTGGYAPWDAKSGVDRRLVCFSRVGVSNNQDIYNPYKHSFPYLSSIFSFQCDLLLHKRGLLGS